MNANQLESEYRTKTKTIEDGHFSDVNCDGDPDFIFIENQLPVYVDWRLLLKS